MKNRITKENQNKILGNQKFENDDFFNEFSEADHKTDSIVSQGLKPVLENTESKKGKIITRVKTGFLIFGFFALINCMGHFYCTLLVYFIQMGIFNEIIGLKRNYEREKPVKITTYIVWYIFIVGSLYAFLRNFSDSFYFTTSRVIMNILAYKSIIAVLLYFLGFSCFVLTLKIGYIRYQIRMFLETHIILLISLATSGAILTIYEGQIWWILSALAVILNDCFAYQFGLLFGKTKLIDLSPNKTWEGFLGGFLGSLVVMRILGSLISLSDIIFLLSNIILSTNRNNSDTF